MTAVRVSAPVPSIASQRKETRAASTRWRAVKGIHFARGELRSSPFSLQVTARIRRAASSPPGNAQRRQAARSASATGSSASAMPYRWPGYSSSFFTCCAR